MKKSSRLAASLVFGTVLLLAGGCKPKEQAALAQDPAGMYWQKTSGAVTAPAWTLKSIDGKDVSSADFKGRILVVDFWATWCPPCVAEAPGYVELQKKYADRGVTFVGISVDADGPAVVQKFRDAKGINFPLVMASDAVIDGFGGVEGLPTTFVIGRDGKILFKKLGGAPEPALDQILAALVK